MFFAVDIGNTNIVIGLHDGATWLHQWRLSTDKSRTVDEYHILLTSLLREHGYSWETIIDVAMCSVVPSLTQLFQAIFSVQDKTVFTVDHTTNTGLILKTEPASSTGADLIVNAAAAFARFKGNCIIIDMGTATTISAVMRPGELLGGSIVPGLETTAHALVEKNIAITTGAFHCTAERDWQ